MKHYYRIFLTTEIVQAVVASSVLLTLGAASMRIAYGATLSESVSEMLTKRGYKLAAVGVYVKQLSTDSVIVALNEHQPYNPASVTKLVTASAALDLLGTRYRFKTMVYCNGPFIRDSGVVHGDLCIRGGGDPGFLAERIWLFVQHLRHLGITRIERDLVLDDCIFDMETQGPGFTEDNSSRAYEAPTAALSASFNTVAVHVAPGSAPGSPVQIHPFPDIAGVKVISTATTAKAGSQADIRVSTEKVDGKTAIVVHGSMNIDAQPRYIYRKVWETWENFGWVLQGMFNECGITLGGSVRRACVSDSLMNAGPFYVFESEPIFNCITPMFKVSSNFAAEMLFKAIAVEKGIVPASWSASAKIVEQWWNDAGLPASIILQNGSGMGNGNKISTLQISSLLERMWNMKAIAPDFLSALAVAGVDGTLEKRFQQSHLKGIIRAKTGTLNDYGVSTLAGYVLLPRSTCAFAIMMNLCGADQYKHWETQQKILEMAFPPSVVK